MALRVTLGKKQLATEAGQALLDLLTEITRDGELSLDEVKRLRAWLEHYRSAGEEVPAIAWLHELVAAVVADGRVTAEERTDLLLAFERILPAEERVLAKTRRKDASQHQEPPTAPRTAPREPPATKRQLDYLRALNATFDPAITKADASELIDQMVGSRNDVSNRQMMVLRFWDRLDMAPAGKGGVSRWMDEYYQEQPLRKDAWDIWKTQNGDRGQQGDPTGVPIGAGHPILEQLRNRAFRRMGVIALALVGALLWLLWKV